MRVKKLSANRRAKGSDEDVAKSPLHERTSSSDWSSGNSSPERATSSRATRTTKPKTFSSSPTEPSARRVMEDVAMGEPSEANSWRDQVDRQVRDAVHAKIVAFLTALKPHAPAKVLDKLPGLAYRMEQTLWTTASSAQEYADDSTLAARLAAIQQSNAKRVLEQQVPAPTRLPVGLGIQNRQPLPEDQARVVFACLQSWRQRMVNLYGATPSEIAPNATLAKLSLFVPSTQQDLLACGITSAQADRFGASLLQEMQKIGVAMANGATTPRAVSPLGYKRGSPTRTKDQGGKKRKTSPVTSPLEAPTLPPSLVSAAMRLNQSNFLSPTSIMSSVAMLARASEAALPPSGLPVLLPSATLGRNSFGLASSSTSSSSSRVSPTAQPSLFPRFPDTTEPHNRMHLLAHEAGQVSKQEEQQHDAKLREMFQQEIDQLRLRLEESEDKRAALEAEVRALREQRHLTAGNASQ